MATFSRKAGIKMFADGGIPEELYLTLRFDYIRRKMNDHWGRRQEKWTKWTEGGRSKKNGFERAVN